jgi:hypothetical protein
MLVFGNAYLEMCRNEETGKIEWLKPLDPCFVAGTYVILKDGTIKMIEDVKMNDYVITHQGRAQKVTETFEREINEEIIKIKLGKFSEPIWVTGNHPILAIKCEDWNRYLYRVRNFRKELKRFKDGKRKKLPVHNIKVPAPQWIEAGKLRKGDIVVYTLNQEIAKGNLKNLRVGDYVSPLKRLHSNYHDISEKIIDVDEDFGELLGWYLAEGSTSRDGIQFSLSKDEEHTALKLLKIIEEKFGVKGSYSFGNKNDISVTINSKQLKEFFEYHCGKHADEKRISNEIIEGASINVLKALLLAYVKGDGFVRKIRSKGTLYSCTSQSLSLTNQLKEIILHLGRVPRLSVDKPGKSGFKSSKPCYTLRWIDGTTRTLSKVDEKYAYIRVQKVERVHYKGKVYNLAVEEDESYNVNYFTAHNCHMRVRRDAYGQVLGYIQLLTFPPVVFANDEICHFKWGAKSWWYEFSYGTSLLRPLLKIQALIDQLEDDMAVIVHTYAKPMLVVKAGTPERPFTDQQLQQLVEAFRDRKPATDVFVRGDVDVEVVPSLTKDVNVTFWLDYLLRQREAVLGVPKIFLGYSEGTNRATAEVVMQEYVTRLRMMQEIIGDTLETVLFKQLIKDEFGEGVEIPKVKWKPIWEPSIQDKAKYLGDLVDKGIILPKEARVQLGFPEEYPITTPEELQAILKRNGAKP